MINRKLYMWSTGIGIALIIALIGVDIIYTHNLTFHIGVDFVSLQEHGIFSGSVWEGSLAMALLLGSTNLIMGWLFWTSIVESFFTIVSYQDKNKSVERMDKRTYYTLYFGILSVHILAFAYDLLIRGLPEDIRPKYLFAYDAGTINTLITISIMMILFSFYLQSRQRLIKLDQQGNGLGENNVTSTRESLEITTEVKGV